MPDTYAVEPRTTLGKRVARLRRRGVLPANIFGRGLESVAVQIEERSVRELLQAHGLNTLISLQIAGEGSPRPVVVRDVGRHPVTRVPLHLDFYQVDLQRTITGSVPVHVTGESPAVRDLGGLLLVGADSVQIEALPADMPNFVEVSMEGLADLDDEITVRDLDLPDTITILSDPDQMLARITRPRGLSAEEEAAEAAAAEAEAAEGAEPEAGDAEEAGS
ncbi:MAG: 50S ribosomal protein L25 [Chloroflexi bacterium]|nr:50S ribosomal protein L25 [Chloroflexota bacterium]